MLEPVSTGIGGDSFALLFQRQTGSVYSVNGSGKSAKLLNVVKCQSRNAHQRHLPLSDPDSITGIPEISE